jgi:CRISPR-associated protein Csx10
MAQLTVTLQQPAQIGTRLLTDNVRRTQAYLPGNVVRGALAAAWIARNGPPTEAAAAKRDLFLHLFEGGLRFGPLYVGEPPTPLSVVRHKYPARDCAEKEFDLVDPSAPSSCPDCDSPLEPAKGEVPDPPPTFRHTSVSVDDSGVAASGALFSTDVIEPGTSFVGVVQPARDDLTADAATMLLEELATLEEIRVGGRRSVYGRALATVSEATGGTRIQRLGDQLIVLRLRSPGVFVDDHGRPGPDPNPTELRHVLGTDATVERRWLRWQHIGGWHAASGLPKPQELAVVAGSTYVLRTAGPVSEETLDRLARRGLGLRRHEGFGDLAGAPRLAMGGRTLQSLYPLRGISTKPQVWSAVLGLLEDHARGGDGAAKLRRVARGWAEPERAALDLALDLGPADLLSVVNEWRNR